MDGIDKVLSGTLPDGAWSSGLKSMLIWLVISRDHACLSRARGQMGQHPLKLTVPILRAHSHRSAYLAKCSTAPAPATQHSRESRELASSGYNLGPVALAASVMLTMTDDFSAHDLSDIWTNVKPQMEPVSKNAQEPIHLIHHAGTMNGPSPEIADASHSFFIGWRHLKILAYEHRDILNPT
ncbi:predicted protein [Histoplasma capsulatum H143]|uniref:Uncharacterized protein n=1 Tax=Ajellomyces capsulatus (strain H143) TaxID=544712 RepID=C6HFL4_AJECH|nr:predicted protein [Histoplasma capsulatum H143]